MDAKWGQSGHNLLFTAASLLYMTRLCAVTTLLCVAMCLQSTGTVALARLGRLIRSPAEVMPDGLTVLSPQRGPAGAVRRHPGDDDQHPDTDTDFVGQTVNRRRYSAVTSV